VFGKLFNPFRRILSRLPRLSKAVMPYAVRAVSIAVASSPSKIDDWAWAKFLEMYPVLASHRSELSRAEIDLVARAVAEILATRAMPEEDRAAIRAAIELVLSGSRDPRPSDGRGGEGGL